MKKDPAIFEGQEIRHLTDVANDETLLRLVQSVSSPRAEPIKLWLAKVGCERMQETPTPHARQRGQQATWPRLK